MSWRRFVQCLSSQRIVVALNGGGEREFAIMDDARVVRGLRRAGAEDFKPGDGVLAVARDGSRDASAILAFPAYEEELHD